MKTNLFKYIFGGMVGLALLGCNSLIEEPLLKDVSNKGASLTIEMGLPLDVQVTKSIANDPRNAQNTWSDWDKFVDGELLYNVTLFVVDSDNNLVGYRQISENSSDVNSINGFYNSNSVVETAVTGNAVKITFPQSNPLHGNVELLNAGNYTLIAVANYEPVTVGSKSYAGLGKQAEDGNGEYNGSADFTQLVQGIISSFSNVSGVSEFTPENYQSFFSYKLSAGNDRVCALNPQPLVMIRKVTLSEGNNTVQGEFSRTFARIRLEVNNRSENTILDVSSLAFKGSYASKNAYLFNDVNAGNANFFGNFSLYEGNANSSDNTKGDLVVSSSDAIVSASSTETRILAGGTDPIFDAYILEGKVAASADFTFTFNACYAAKMEDGDATHNAMIASFFSDNKYNGSSSGGNNNWWPSYSSTYYGIIDPAFYIFIRSKNSNVSTCLMADVQTMTAAVENANAGNEQNNTFKMAPEFIWEIEIPDGKSSVTKISTYVEYAPGYLKSLSSNLYLQPYDGRSSKVPVLGSNPGDVIFKMDFGSEDEHGTVFCMYNNKYYYLNGGTCEWTGPVNNMNDYKMQTFETIVAEPVSPKEKVITSHIQVNGSSGASVRKDEITRNDFYRGVIPVNIQN